MQCDQSAEDSEERETGMSGKPDEGAGERRMMGSLREALAAAGRSEPHGALMAAAEREPKTPPPVPQLPVAVEPGQRRDELPGPAQAALEARGGAGGDGAPQTRVVRAGSSRTGTAATLARTQLLRGKGAPKKTDFHQDPVVGWLVVVGGAGLGAFRPVFEGNNTMGRASSQRIPIDFGDETISGEEQAYIRYDSVDRRFLLVPNLAKTNIVAVNDKKPTGAVELAAMDVITMGRTQLVFVPFCGADFDWGELTEMQG
jgi:hypothetical protein